MNNYVYLLRLPVAAVLFFHGSAFAGISVIFDQTHQGIIIGGLSKQALQEVMANPQKVTLQLAGAAAKHSMPLAVERTGQKINVKPKFALLPGSDYVLSASLSEHVKKFTFTVPKREITTPVLTGFSPSQSVVPENTLRFYLHFSEPMAVGQLRDSLVLLDQAGMSVDNPFLNLDTELWNRTHTRVTVLIDPGRLKRGVGPNMETGAPLTNGERYQLKIQASFSSAMGAAIGRDIYLNFRAGPAERRKIDPHNWQISVPAALTSDAITVAFDRIMDSALVSRLISVHDSKGKRVDGHTAGDGGGWSIIPVNPWEPDTYFLTINADIEDVSGNTIRASFDAVASAEDVVADFVHLPITVD